MVAPMFEERENSLVSIIVWKIKKNKRIYSWVEKRSNIKTKRPVIQASNPPRKAQDGEGSLLFPLLSWQKGLLYFFFFSKIIPCTNSRTADNNTY